MQGLTVGEIAAAVGGELLGGAADTRIYHISTDSRRMAGDDLFVPIIGERFDAHDFIDKAFAAGAAACLTSRRPDAAVDKPHIYVEDTLRALQRLGAFCRKRLTMPIIGITGSVGKTTTREMVAAALAASGAVYATAGNSNGQIGVPITLFGADHGASACVLEMGMSLPGEMAVIAGIARPDMAIITNIGTAHIGNLGSRERICEEKMHIADYLSDGLLHKPDGLPLILNGDEPLLRQAAADLQAPCLFYGMSEDCAVRAWDIRLSEDSADFTAVLRVPEEQRIPVRLNVPGLHNVMNALAALSAAALLGRDLAAAARALADFGGFKRRLERKEVAGLHVIDDSYNAGPESMRAALGVLAASGAGADDSSGAGCDDASAAGCGRSFRRVAVLGDMLELGEEELRYHRELARCCADLPIDLFVTVGHLMRHAGEELIRLGCSAVCCDTLSQAADAVKADTRPGDYVLFKGSNGMHLWEILPMLMED